MDWLATLDFDQALANVRTDVIGDWYRDPWGWCELEWLVKKRLTDFAPSRLASTGVKATVSLDVPKENFAVRPAVVLDPFDRLVYQALVDRLSVRLVGNLNPWVYGWRLGRRQPTSGTYARNNKEWDGFRDHLERLAKCSTAALTTDVVSFFGSIPVEPLVEQIVGRGRNAPAERLADLVTSWYVATGRGLPQRCAASAVLAHMYLQPLDDVLQQYNELRGLIRLISPRGRSLRWMDDMWLFDQDGLDLRAAQLAIQGTLRQLDLEMNVGKTALLEGDEMIRTVFEIEHSAVDSGIAKSQRDLKPLDDLIDGLIADPENAERTSIRFATTRMRDHTIFKRVEALAEVAEHMPHGADHLARLFRDSGYWQELQDWYVGYSTRWTVRLPWSVGQLGTMFPSNINVAPELIGVFCQALATPGTPLPLLSLASQRLAAWAPDDARPLLREASTRESHPLALRSLALAALHAGEVRKVVRRMLQQHEENAITLAMLEEVNFTDRAVPVSADFAGWS